MNVGAGMVAFAVPALIVNVSGTRSEMAMATTLLFALGLLALLACVREFYIAGKGTLAPWAPPVNLVTSGLYRVTRNPMYVAVLLILLAWFLLSPTADIALYTLRVVLGEEPWLKRTFGNAWAAYSASVPRWLWPMRP